MISDHYATRTRIVVDLFGPLIDVSIVDALHGTKARFNTESAIAERLKQLRRPAPSDKGWDDDAVRDVVRSYLTNPKLALPLIDGEVLRLLCEAAAAGAEVKVVSSVPDADLFNCARSALVKYMGSFVHSTAISVNDFHHHPRLGEGPHGIEFYLRNNSTELFTVVVDDGPPFSLADGADLIPGEHYNEWLPGEEPERLADRLRSVLRRRARIGASLTFIASHADGLSLSQYSAIREFLVCDPDARREIAGVVKTIRQLSDHEQDGAPICVFLSGAPGSGKSFFVKQCAAELKAKEDYPVVSLSGVPDTKFDDAVRDHIDQVYEIDSKSPRSIAFVDEIDTISAGRTAFRLMMEAMTGTRTTARGVSKKGSKSGSVSRLVWFFAGSRGRDPEEFIARFEAADPKVRDFFDRIHFSVKLPGADQADQAVILALASIGKYDRDKRIKRVAKQVLLLFGATEWNSVRQVDTICRLAVGQTRIDDNDLLELEDFRDVGTIESFRHTYEMVSRSEDLRGEYVPVDFALGAPTPNSGRD